jgi:hypothetical protein
MPMDLNSTPFLTYAEIRVDKIDLIEDAFGFNSEFSDVIEMLDLIKEVPPRGLTRDLKVKLRRKV